MSQPGVPLSGVSLRRLKRPGRASLLATLAGVLVVGTALIVGTQRVARQRAAEEAFPIASGQLRVEGLSARLEIARDDRGIPHVLAQGEGDGWFGLGFVHAQDRLAQMVWLRRLASGRVAEWLGEEGLAWDRLARTIGFSHHAEALVARLDPDISLALEAYAAGVNARLARIRSGRVG